MFMPYSRMLWACLFPMHGPGLTINACRLSLSVFESSFYSPEISKRKFMVVIFQLKAGLLLTIGVQYFSLHFFNSAVEVPLKP